MTIAQTVKKGVQLWRRVVPNNVCPTIYLKWHEIQVNETNNVQIKYRLLSPYLEDFLSHAEASGEPSLSAALRTPCFRLRCRCVKTPLAPICGRVAVPEPDALRDTDLGMNAGMSFWRYSACLWHVRSPTSLLPWQYPSQLHRWVGGAMGRGQTDLIAVSRTIMYITDFNTYIYARWRSSFIPSLTIPAPRTRNRLIHPVSISLGLSNGLVYRALLNSSYAIHF